MVYHSEQKSALMEKNSLWWIGVDMTTPWTYLWRMTAVIVNATFWTTRRCIDSMSEIWKDVKGFEGIYKVNRDGDIRRINRSKPLTPKMNCGYAKVTLSNNGKPVTLYVHRVVAEAFVENPDNLPLVYHKDGDRTNNRADNLEWDNKRYVIRKCAWCGKEMVQTIHNRAYCSDECRNSAKAKRDAERLKEHIKPKADEPPKSNWKPSRPRMINDIEYCRNYAEHQKEETLRLLREGQL